MTRTGTYVLTAIAVVLYIVFMQFLGGGFFGPPFWDSEAWVDSALITYLFLLFIIAAGVVQANRLPPAGVSLTPSGSAPETAGQVEDPAFWRLLTGNVYFSLIWLPLRLFVGREWFSSGVGKFGSPAWMEDGSALRGFLETAVAIPEAPARPRITYDWYRDFLQFIIDQEAYVWFAKLVVWGELLVGLGLIFGALVGFAAFFGTILNFNFLLAGTASSNPVLFGLSVLLVLAWKVAGFWGLDRWLLPLLGTPWNTGRLFGAQESELPTGGARPRQ